MDYIKLKENGEIQAFYSATAPLLDDVSVENNLPLEIDLETLMKTRIYNFALGLFETVIEKPSPDYIWDSGWVLDIDAIRKKKSKEIKSNCSIQIISGFSSTALGSEHHYPSDATDQLNLSATVQRASLSDVTSTDTFPFLCKDSNDIWDYRMHTQAQMETLGADAYNFILAARVKNAQLQAQIQSATTVEAINSIQW